MKENNHFFSSRSWQVFNILRETTLVQLCLRVQTVTFCHIFPHFSHLYRHLCLIIHAKVCCPSRLKFKITFQKFLTWRSLDGATGHVKAELSGDDQLWLGRVHQSEEVSHLQLGVGQRDGLLEELDGSGQIASLNFDGAQGFVRKLTLLVNAVLVEKNVRYQCIF